jgi:hypothetical protein
MDALLGTNIGRFSNDEHEHLNKKIIGNILLLFQNLCFLWF